MTHTPHHPLEPVPARSFTPVPVRARHDGWTPARQAAFIEALAGCGCVTDAAARVGMASDGAYDLRRREGSASFRMAWDKALDLAVKRLSEAAFSRALHGVVRPHYYQGELVGEHRVFNESLTRFLLQHLDPGRFAPQAGLTLYNRDEAKTVALADAVRDMVADAQADAVDDAEAELQAPVASEPEVAMAAETAPADTRPAGITPANNAPPGTSPADVSPALPVSGRLSDDWRAYVDSNSPVYERWGDEDFPPGKGEAWQRGRKTLTQPSPERSGEG